LAALDVVYHLQEDLVKSCKNHGLSGWAQRRWVEPTLQVG
jgi:hypothetical protein